MTMEPRQSDVERERQAILRSARWGRRVACLIIVGGVAVVAVAVVRGRWVAVPLGALAVAVGVLAFVLFQISREAVE
jgi:hypothetical protein